MPDLRDDVKVLAEKWKNAAKCIRPTVEKRMLKRHASLLRILAREDERRHAPAPANSGWWCDTCQRWCNWNEITFEEYHDSRYGGCGNKVVNKPHAPASDGLRVAADRATTVWVQNRDDLPKALDDAMKELDEVLSEAALRPKDEPREGE